MLRRWTLSGLAFLLTAFAAPNDFEPTSSYERREVRGWSILVERALLKQEPKVADDVLALLDDQLFQVGRKVPPAALAKLRKVTIWVETNEPHHPCMVYHPDRGWLRDHGMNPDKGRCVEISNARRFLSWTKEQPWMVLHELAHAYHDQFLTGGFDNGEVERVYRSSIKAGRYASVLHFDGKEAPAYAGTNAKEYFAEVSEAYFGTNDFYPFVRAELKRHDPEAEALLGKLWGVEEGR